MALIRRTSPSESRRTPSCDKLKPRYRTLVELRYYKEYSYEEIAEELDLPLGTVKAQLFRARDFLLNLMESRKDQI
jgi:RNA polymerase sigma factor (sigma-70 family)